MNWSVVSKASKAVLIVTVMAACFWTGQLWEYQGHKLTTQYNITASQGRMELPAQAQEAARQLGRIKEAIWAGLVLLFISIYAESKANPRHWLNHKEAEKNE